MSEIELLEKILEEQKEHTKLISHIGIILARATWLLVILIFVTIIF